MPFDQNVLVELLRSLDKSRKSIEGASNYMKSHKDFSTKSVQIWKNQFIEANGTHKIYMLFVANEVIQDNTDYTYRSEFERVLPSCFQQLGSDVDEQKIETLMNKWLQKKTFSKEFIDRLGQSLRLEESGSTESQIINTMKLMMNTLAQESSRMATIKKKIESIDRGVLSGNTRSLEQAKENEELYSLIKSYEDLLLKDMKNRVEFEQLLQNILYDVIKINRANHDALRDLQSSRRTYESSRLDRLQGRSGESSYGSDSRHDRYRDERSSRDSQPVRDERSSRDNYPTRDERSSRSESSRDNYSTRDERSSRSEPSREDRHDRRSRDREESSKRSYDSRHAYDSPSQSKRPKRSEEGRANKPSQQKRSEEKGSKNNREANHSKNQSDERGNSSNADDWSAFANTNDDWGAPSSQSKPTKSNTDDSWGAPPSQPKPTKPKNDDDWGTPSASKQEASTPPTKHVPESKHDAENTMEMETNTGTSEVTRGQDEKTNAGDDWSVYKSGDQNNDDWD